MVVSNVNEENDEISLDCAPCICSAELFYYRYSCCI